MGSVAKVGRFGFVVFLDSEDVTKLGWTTPFVKEAR